MENTQDKRIFEVITNDLGEFILMDDGSGQKWGVPKDPANSDYQAYLKSVEHLTEIPPQAALSTPNV